MPRLALNTVYTAKISVYGLVRRNHSHHEKSEAVDDRKGYAKSNVNNNKQARLSRSCLQLSRIIYTLRTDTQIWENRTCIANSAHNNSCPLLPLFISKMVELNNIVRLTRIAVFGKWTSHY